MKKVFAIALLTLLTNASPVRAVDWIKVSIDSQDKEWYVDAKSVSRRGSSVWFTYRTTRSESGRVVAQGQGRVSASCQTGEYRIREYKAIEDGEIVYSEKQGSKAMLETVTPGTSFEHVFQFACSR